MFARRGVRCEIVVDSMPFECMAMRNLVESWIFKITTSSPRYAQSNWMAGKAIRTANTILKEAEKDGSDPYITLLEYRNAPVFGLQYSPVELLTIRLPIFFRHRLPKGLLQPP